MILHKMRVDKLAKIYYNVEYKTIRHSTVARLTSLFSQGGTGMDGRAQGMGKRLRMLNNAIRRYMDRYSRKTEIDHLTCSNGWIIGHIAENGGSAFQKDLESEFGITRSTCSKVIILLEKKGMLKRESVSHDARLKKITLTEKSMEVFKIMQEDGDRVEARLTKGFTPQELDILYGYFDRIQANLDEAEKEQVI